MPRLRFTCLVGVGLLNVAVACTPHPSPEAGPPKSVEPIAEPDAAGAAAFPYWRSADVNVALFQASTPLPLPASAITSSGAEADASLHAELLASGAALRPLATPEHDVGAFYEARAAAGVPTVLTVDALFAVTLLAIDDALAEAETRVVIPALRTALARLDTRLTAAAKGVPGDLREGLSLAEGVVAVASSLLDPKYAPPPFVASAVKVELDRVNAHAGVALSPLLGASLDYTSFAPRGALAGANAETRGAYLAAQWLANASFTFGAGEESRQVAMSSAWARTRGALLVARLVTGADSDAPLRTALTDLDRLGAFTFGEPAGTSPIAFAALATAQGFDLHDAKAIADPVRLDRLRRTAATRAHSMELVPLRLAPETARWTNGGPEARLGDVVGYLNATTTSESHASLYASALGVLRRWLAPSAVDRAWPAPGTSATKAWPGRKEDAALAAWALLRHASVPFARATPRPAAVTGSVTPGPRGLGATSLFLVEPHPEAIAGLLALVDQTRDGLLALHAILPASASVARLNEVASILRVALIATKEEVEEPATFLAHAPELARIPGRITAIEAALGAAAAPYAAVVDVDAATGDAYEVGTIGLATLSVVVPDPRTGHLVVAQGASVLHDTATAPAKEGATDEAWGTRPRSPKSTEKDPFAGTLPAP